MTLRAVFMGTPDIAVGALDALTEVAEVVAVVCQPDRPAGRGMKLKPPAVKVRALELGLPVEQPRKVRSGAFATWLTEQRVDVALVMAYGRILPSDVLSAPNKGCINLHASLLPLYRGAAPINWVIADGHTQTGISLMQMDVGCDTGPVFSKHAIDIDANETAGTLAARLSVLAGQVVRADLVRAVSGQLVAQPQDDEHATHARMLTKEDGRIDFSGPAKSVHDRIRAMSPWPGAFTTLGDKRFRLLQTTLASETEDHEATPGTVVSIDKSRALIACGQGTLALHQGQVAGKRALDVQALHAGRTLETGSRLG